MDCEVAGSFNHAAGEAGARVSSHRLKYEIVCGYFVFVGINQNVKISDKKYTRTLSARPVEERIRNMLSRNRLFIFVSRQALKCAPSDHCMDSGTFRVLHSKLNW